MAKSQWTCQLYNYSVTMSSQHFKMLVVVVVVVAFVEKLLLQDFDMFGSSHKGSKVSELSKYTPHLSYHNLVVQID